MIVVAVSGGIDSMVLLDYLYQQKYNIVIAHVNYQKRIDSYKDAEIIREYIQNKNIFYEELVVCEKMYTNENFQTQARKIRYNFFNEVAKKYKTNQVFVAHHQDDFLETYIFKRERKGLYNYYGIKKQSLYMDMYINRPLIEMTKEEIKSYAHFNNIDYYEDSSNLELDYTRNKIRKYLKSITLEQKDKMLEDAKELNEQIARENEVVRLNMVNFIELDDFKKWTINIKRRWIFAQFKKYDITIKNIDDIIAKIENTKRFEVTFLDTTIAKAYDIIYILNNLSNNYSFIIKNTDDYSKFARKWKELYNYSIKKNDVNYPFLIRNYRMSDFDKLDLDYKKFRLRIKKQKIPFFLRNYLPIIEKDNEVKGFIF